MKRKPGRPTTFTPKAEERLLMLVSTGKTFREACRALKIDYHAVINRRFADDAFNHRSARATLLGVEANIDMCEERLKRSTNKRIAVDRELAHHYRWKASKLLSAYKPPAAPGMAVHVNAGDPTAPRLSADQERRSVLERARRIAFILELGARAAEATRREAEAMRPRPGPLLLAAEIDVTPADDGSNSDASV